MVRARKLRKSVTLGGRADEFLDVRPRMGPGWLAMGKFGSKTKYLTKSHLSGPISGLETAKTEKTNHSFFVFVASQAVSFNSATPVLGELN